MKTTSRKKNKKEVSTVEVVITNDNPDLVAVRISQLMPQIIHRIVQREISKE